MPVAAQLTRHGKGPQLAQHIGVISITHWDTDQLGTFSGEVERPMPTLDVVA
jgi:hypothetical protein